MADGTIGVNHPEHNMPPVKRKAYIYPALSSSEGIPLEVLQTRLHIIADYSFGIQSVTERIRDGQSSDAEIKGLARLIISGVKQIIFQTNNLEPYLPETAFATDDLEAFILEEAESFPPEDTLE